MFSSLLRPPILGLALAAGAATADQPVVNIYNWNDYFAEDTLERFEATTGIKPVLDLYDSNEVLEAKLLAGRSGYDLVFPTARPFAARHIQARIYRELERARLPRWDNLDPGILGSLEDMDPGNRYLVPYMWGTTGLGINVDKVKAALGDVAVDTWALVFDPAQAAKLADCGISLMDDPTEVVSAALAYLGRDPDSDAKADMDAAQDLLQKARPHIRYFHSSQYINDLSNGDLCVAHAYSGDTLQARDRAEEANNGVQVAYLIPREGAVLWTDVIAIPKDAPNPDQALALINFLLDPQVIASVSNYVNYANANKASLPYLDAGVRNDPGIYPTADVRKKLFVLKSRSDKEIRSLNRLWTRIKANR